MHWLSGCTRLAPVEYLKRHNNVPMIHVWHCGYKKDCWEKI